MCSVCKYVTILLNALRINNFKINLLAGISKYNTCTIKYRSIYNHHLQTLFVKIYYLLIEKVFWKSNSNCYYLTKLQICSMSQTNFLYNICCLNVHCICNSQLFLMYQLSWNNFSEYLFY